MSARLTAARALSLFARARAARAPSTRRLELRALRAILPRLGAPLSRVRRADVEAWLAGRLAEVRPATAARELSSLRSLYRVLRAEGLVQHDPTRGLAVRVEPDAQRRVLLAERALPDLLAEASRVPRARRAPEVRRALALRNRAALELLYGLGLRAGEVCGARLVDLDLAGATLRVERVKGCAPAALPLTPALVSHLSVYLTRGRAALLAGRPDPGHVLVNERARALTPGHLGRLVTRIAARAGHAAHPHALRRSLATHLVRAGAPLPAVQHLLGHSSLDTTQRYVCTDPEQLRAAVDLLDPL